MSETKTKWNSKKEKELDELLYLDQLDKSRVNLLDFTKTTLDGFEAEAFHKTYYKILDAFSKGHIKRLMVTMPPQHGKTEGSTRRLPAYMLGRNPDLKIAIASYNFYFASKLNRDVQRILDSPSYHKIFPETTLSRNNVVTKIGSFLRNGNEFEVVGATGGLKSVGRGGPLTGNKVDIMVMDDLYKDYMEANSPIVRDSVWDWYTTVVDSRLHNDSQQLIVFTRWHEEDLIGRLESKGKVKTITKFEQIYEPIKSDEWIKINFQAIKDSEQTELDPREKGDVLWTNRHNKEGLMNTMALDVEKFNCLYQGNPESQEGLMYSAFKTYKHLPEFKQIKCYVDTADSGTDKLCAIVYGIPLATVDEHLYVLDVLYTDESMEFTEPATVELLNKNNVTLANVESNNGGRGFARVIQKETVCHIAWFHQSNNKEARIFSNSAIVNRKVVMPDDWFMRWTDFYNDMTKYKKLFRANKHDDGPDAITGMVEQETKPQVFTF